jgi:cell division transport system permease protein
LLSLLGIGIALALPAGGHLLLSQVATLTQGAAATPQLTVFMSLDADRAAAQAIEAKLKARPGIARTQLLAREDTLARMKAAEGLADVIAALPKNPFPDAIVATPGDDSPAAMEALAAEARQWAKVEHVQIDADWARRLQALLKLAHTGVWLLAGLLGLGLVTITFNTIRLQVLTRQAEVAVSQLLGATDAFISRPFHWYGALLGLFGGVAAWLIVAALAGPAGGRTGPTLWLNASAGLAWSRGFPDPAGRGGTPGLAGRGAVCLSASAARVARLPFSPPFRPVPFAPSRRFLVARCAR